MTKNKIRTANGSMYAILSICVVLLIFMTACGTAQTRVENGVTIDCTHTESLTEGPFYTPDTPLRTNLSEPNDTATRLMLTGTVYDTNCQPIQGAKVDFWHTDENGDYDNNGYRYRGHQLTDANGNYALESILPVEYSDGGTMRTSHLHVKVFGTDDRELLTTQLFIEGNHDPSDPIYHPSLVTDGQQIVDGTITTQYDFYINP